MAAGSTRLDLQLHSSFAIIQPQLSEGRPWPGPGHGATSKPSLRTKQFCALIYLLGAICLAWETEIKSASIDLQTLKERRVTSQWKTQNATVQRKNIRSRKQTKLTSVQGQLVLSHLDLLDLGTVFLNRPEIEYKTQLLVLIMFSK